VDLSECLKERVLSFFDDGDETVRRPSRGGSTPAAQARPRQPRPGARSLQLDRHTLLVRRRVAAGVALVLLILIVFGINACLKSEKRDELKSYNRGVSELSEAFDSGVSRPLFSALTGAAGKSAITVQVQIDQLRQQAQLLSAKARGLSAPGDMSGAQRNLALAFDLRAEALVKIAALVPAALGGQDKQATTKIAGDMELLLASDVIYAERVAPLISQTLKADGVEGEGTASSRSLPNLGWLEPTTAQARISGQAASSTQSGSFTPGNHGSALKGVSVGPNTLEVEPTLNHVAGGGSPTFTLDVENSGEFPETNVKVDVTVTAAGKVFKASHLLEKTEPGKAVSVDIPLAGIPLGVAAKIQANIEGVQGENDLENNKSTYLAIFGK
jgi:hypothetical protein